MEQNLVYCSITLILSLIIYKVIFSYKETNRRQQQPPSPPGSVPVLGHLLLLKPPLHQTLARLATLHGPVLRLRFGIRPVIIVSSSTHAAECLSNNDAAFANRPQFLATKHFGYNFTTVDTANYGPHLRALRRVMTLQLLSPARVSALSAVREDQVRSTLRRLYERPGRAVMRPVIAELTFGAMVRMVMGRKEESEGKDEKRSFRDVVEDVFLLTAALCMEDCLPWVGWVANGTRRRILKVAKEMDGILQKLVDERKKMKKVDGDARAGAEEEEGKKMVIDELLALQEEDPRQYSDDIIKGVLLTLVRGGTDTSTVTLEWAMALLLNHPDVLSKSRAEIDAQVGNGRLICDGDLPKLPYLHNIIKETLRLFPAAPVLLPHESAEDTSIGGFHVARGTQLFINAYAVQRDPENWAEPDKFDPDRFEVGLGRSFKYFPFGMGRRGCPGENLAMKMMGLALGSFIQCFDWDRIGQQLVDLAQGDRLAMVKAQQLEAICRPRPEMAHVLSQL